MINTFGVLLHHISRTKPGNASILSVNIPYFSRPMSSSSSDPLQKYSELFDVKNETNPLYLHLKSIIKDDPLIPESSIEPVIRLINSGLTLPSKITDKQWRKMLLSSTLGRKLLIKNLLKREEIKLQKKERKMISWKNYQAYKEKLKCNPLPGKTTSTPLYYNLSNTTLFRRIKYSSINSFLNYQLIDTSVDSPVIGFDFSYEQFMTFREIQSAARQISLCWNANRDNLKPANVIFFNFSEKSIIFNELTKICHLTDGIADFSSHCTNLNCTDLFPKEDIIYLSPHAVDVMETYDPRKVYIIGVLVDVCMPEPLSLTKANKDGVKVVRFPLHNYVNWNTGGKRLNIDHCLKILLDLKNGYNWKDSFVRNISRKLKEIHPEEKVDENSLLSAQTIKELYRKNKVHDLLLQEAGLK